MKFIQPKYILSTLVVVAIAIWGYTQYTNTDIGHEGVKLANTIMVSSEAVETDTSKRLESLGNSGSVLTVSPFGSGKPLAEEPKQKFQKPNTEWKARTINGITYRQGEGNPVGAKALSEKEIEAYKNCVREPELSQVSCGLPDDRANGYVTAELERDLIILLSHKNWEPILTKCEQHFRKYEFSDWEVTYDKVMNEDAMNIENMITIDPENGRKELIYGNFGHLNSWFRNALREKDRNFTDSDIFKFNNCITQNGGFELYRLFDIVHQKQFYPF
jgi:hypothetical protein